MQGVVSRLVLLPRPAGRVVVRGMAQRVKRFYTDVHVGGGAGGHLVHLDAAPLRTPKGRVLELPSRPLALAVGQEWAAVGEGAEIVPSFMHLTGLSYTVTDNPQRFTKADMTDALLEYLPTDTMLFADTQSDKLMALQEKQWWPVLQWFNSRYGAALEPSRSLAPVTVAAGDVAALRRSLATLDDWAVAGLLFSVETVKSVLLTLAAFERRLTARDAVALSRLETEHQVAKWGRVPWSHDMEMHDTEARFAAGLLFAHLTTETEEVTTKVLKA